MSSKHVSANEGVCIFGRKQDTISSLSHSSMELAIAGPSSNATQVDHERNELTQASDVPVGWQRLDVGYAYSVDMNAHQNEGGHDECPARISTINAFFRDNRLLTKMKIIPVRHAVREEVLLVHSEDLWEKVIALRGLSN